mmetsp:Transcript_5280/g.8017  ORF Transcript_5280/g.8017 Transcript_5280/m.8017 type:complete len:272 (-) Transcript_5280:72-887(-)
MKHLLSLPKELFALHALKPRNISNEWLHGSVSSLTCSSSVEVGTAFNAASCGCLCQFQLTVNDEGFIKETKYASARLSPGNIVEDQSSVHVNACKCQVVRGVSSLTSEYMRGKKLDFARNSIVLSPRAPSAVLSTVLRQIDVPKERLPCLRLVERAAMSALSGISSAQAVEPEQECEWSGQKLANSYLRGNTKVPAGFYNSQSKDQYRDPEGDVEHFRPFGNLLDFRQGLDGADECEEPESGGFLDPEDQGEDYLPFSKILDFREQEEYRI